MSVSATIGMVNVTVTIPIYARSEANRRDHWSAKSSRVSQQRGFTAAYLRGAANLVNFVRRLDTSQRFKVTLTRIHRRRVKPLDDDNLRSSLKAVRDGVADAIGIDDGDKRVIWDYAQEPGSDYAVRIQINSSASSAPKRKGATP